MPRLAQEGGREGGEKEGRREGEREGGREGETGASGELQRLLLGLGRAVSDVAKVRVVPVACSFSHSTLALSASSSTCVCQRWMNKDRDPWTDSLSTVEMGGEEERRARTRGSGESDDNTHTGARSAIGMHAHAITHMQAPERSFSLR